ncbi:MAG: DNA repair protein RadA, partial [Lachnospiraceae bacterium]|nr:DNA repair protein RadA [Lachnospiraceae bacterium]
GLKLAECDAYINVAGGMRMNEPAIDLGIALSVASSFGNKVIPADTAAFGEVGLSGEVRSVSMAQNRAAEAAKLGFSRLIVPEGNASQLKDIKGTKIIPAASLADAIRAL